MMIEYRPIHLMSSTDVAAEMLQHQKRVAELDAELAESTRRLEWIRTAAEKSDDTGILSGKGSVSLVVKQQPSALTKSIYRWSRNVSALLWSSWF